MNINKVKKLEIPKSPGSYQFLDKNKKIIYIGKASNLRSRVFSYWRESANHSVAKHSMMKQIEDVKWVETDSEIEALLLEVNLIKKYQPKYNVVLRDDKRYVYIKVSIEDVWPRVFVTRNLDQEGKYFGPFVSSEAVRETLKAIRKIWSFRSCSIMPKKVCLYYRIGKCSGPCEEKISQKNYQDIIKQVVKFLNGNKKEVIRDIEKQIKNQKSQIKKLKEGSDKYHEIEKEIENCKLKISKLNYVLANNNILSLQDKYVADVVELAKILGLPKVPERIEGYDISNIYGKEAVGSMVVFKNGEPNKSEYRKFKIKVDHGHASDTGMLKEVLERRLLRIQPPPNPLLEKPARRLGGERGLSNDLKKINFVPPSFSSSSLPLPEGEVGGGGSRRGSKSWPKPDLIIVDGGKGQLNAVFSMLKKFKLEKDIFAIAVSKGAGLRSANAPDKIFFPGEKQALELPLASPALHLIKRVRDEAHRFAIEYHRRLRGKRFLKKRIT